MKLNFWEYKIKDICTYPSDIFNAKLSILANAVYAANYDLLNLIEQGETVLEIGCGIESRIKDGLSDEQWKGIDVYSFDYKGRPSIATDIASVINMPYENDSFNYVLSNQSIEHWYEYNVDIKDAIDEIMRVLKVGGKLFINFPVHLHGKKEFVLGDFNKIDNYFNSDNYEIIDRVAYIDSNQKNYEGWKCSSIPYFYVKRNKSAEDTSYFVEYIIEKKYDTNKERSNNDRLNIPKRKSLLSRTIQYGCAVLVWRIYNKILKVLRLRNKMKIKA